MSETVIKCESVYKIFGENAKKMLEESNGNVDAKTFQEKGCIVGVNNASFEVVKGEMLVVMGLSGSGKSTVVRCISRLIEPTSGGVHIEGENLLSATDEKLIDIRRQKMGMVFQHFALLPNRDVLGNVAFPLQVQGVGRKEREAKAAEMISLVGLEGREDYFPSELSGGQQQRVGIARSLASDPSIWFLDEPFSALDPLIRADLQDELLRLQAQLNKTIVFITHDLDEAIKIADRIAIMDQGRIVQIGSPEELILKPENDYVARFTKGVPRSKVVKASSIMRKTDNSDPENSIFVKPDDRIADVSEILTKSNSTIAVRDEAGKIHGVIDRETFIQVLAGATI